MSSYIIELDPTSTIDQITNAVRFEEAGSAKFIKSEISFYNNRATNLAVFEALQPGLVLPSITFVRAGTPIPAGAQQVWAGVMIVDGTNAAVCAYR